MTDLTLAWTIVGAEEKCDCDISLMAAQGVVKILKQKWKKPIGAKETLGTQGSSKKGPLCSE